MYAETKKLHIIEEVLKVNNDAILIELENVLSRSTTVTKNRFTDMADLLSAEEVDEFERNINEGCEQINEDDWK
jgi:hypothetical protein